MKFTEISFLHEIVKLRPASILLLRIIHVPYDTIASVKLELTTEKPLFFAFTKPLRLVKKLLLN